MLLLLQMVLQPQPAMLLVIQPRLLHVRLVV
jgi:hypothetical protein